MTFWNAGLPHVEGGTGIVVPARLRPTRRSRDEAKTQISPTQSSAPSAEAAAAAFAAHFGSGASEEPPIGLSDPVSLQRLSQTPRLLVETPDDLLELEDLSDLDLLRALWLRYERTLIYTWVGSVLVSVNPYRDVGAFRPEVAAGYASAHPPHAPHLYAVANAALADHGNKQHALLITGESGAGKTAATSAVLGFLAARRASKDCLRDRLQRSTPVLAAFGNATTRQNANSSRFGKFMEVHLARSGEVLGATLRPYMLEASRVSGDLPAGERTYHVFYFLRAALCALSPSAEVAPSRAKRCLWESMATAAEWAEVARLGGPALAASPRLVAASPSEEAACLEGFESLVEGLLGAGMRHSEVAECCRLVAAVALLTDWGGEAVDGGACGALSSVASLLRMGECDLRAFLSGVETTVGGTGRERYFRTRSDRESATLRASLAQELYSTLFAWLTRRVAKSIAPPEGGEACARTLGLLDLYGFEVFASNGFEQFLINYCNERMQQFFNRQVFAREAAEYEAEGFDVDGQWKRMTEACRLPALALLEGEGSSALAVFGVINDRSRCGFDGAVSLGPEGLAAAISAACGPHPALCRARRDAGRVFGVRHFAGEVYYETSQFVRKNASAHRPDIVAFLRDHASAFVSEMLSLAEGQTDVSDGPRGKRDDGGPSRDGRSGRGAKAELSGQSPRSAHAPASVHKAAAARPRRLFGRTLISVFQQELNELAATLEARECHHVRCLRPNDDQAPLDFDDGSMLRQCRYSGLLEATRIRRYGFAHRRPLRAFASRYATLLDRHACRHMAGVAATLGGASAGSGRGATALAMSATSEVVAEACLAIVSIASERGMPAEAARVGRTKVFLQESALAWLEERRNAAAARAIAGLARGFLLRRRLRLLRRGVVSIQARARGAAARSLAEQLRSERERARSEAAARADRLRGAAVLQRAWRARRCRVAPALSTVAAAAVAMPASPLRELPSPSSPAPARRLERRREARAQKENDPGRLGKAPGALIAGRQAEKLGPALAATARRLAVSPPPRLRATAAPHSKALMTTPQLSHRQLRPHRAPLAELWTPSPSMAAAAAAAFTPVAQTPGRVCNAATRPLSYCRALSAADFHRSASLAPGVGPPLMPTVAVPALPRRSSSVRARRAASPPRAGPCASPDHSGRFVWPFHRESLRLGRSPLVLYVRASSPARVQARSASPPRRAWAFAPLGPGPWEPAPAGPGTWAWQPPSAPSEPGVEATAARGLPTLSSTFPSQFCGVAVPQHAVARVAQGLPSVPTAGASQQVSWMRPPPQSQMQPSWAQVSQPWFHPAPRPQAPPIGASPRRVRIVAPQAAKSAPRAPVLVAIESSPKALLGASPSSAPSASPYEASFRLGLWTARSYVPPPPGVGAM